MEHQLYITYKTLGELPRRSLESGDMAGVYSKDVLRKASSQLKQAKRFDKDELKDIMIRNDAIIASDKEKNFERKLPGFVQSAEVMKKNYIFHNEDGLKAYSKSSSKNLHVDATGSLINKKDGKRFYYYSVVYKDPLSSDSPTPLSGMLTTSHTGYDFGEFLATIQRDYQKVNQARMMPDELVIDCSGAMLQGVLIAFQLGTLPDYLDKSFAEPASVNVKLKLCKSHMIKSFVNKVSTYSSIPKKDRKILNVFFARMLESQIVEGVEDNFKGLCNCLLNKSSLEVIQTLGVEDYGQIEGDEPMIYEGLTETEKPNKRLRDIALAGRHFNEIANSVKAFTSDAEQQKQLTSCINLK